jgi:hypothetical protein
MLSTLNPEYDWLPWKFDRLPDQYWNDLQNQRKFLDWAARQLNIEKFSGWYSVKIKVDFQLENYCNHFRI